MYLGVRKQTREESYVDKSAQPEPRRRIRTVEFNEFWLEESRSVVDDILAQDDPHYLAVRYFEITEDEDGGLSLSEIPRV